VRKHDASMFNTALVPKRKQEKPV